MHAVLWLARHSNDNQAVRLHDNGLLPFVCVSSTALHAVVWYIDCGHI